MKKIFLFSFFKGFLLTSGITFCSYSSILFVQENFNQKDFNRLITPFILSLLFFYLILASHYFNKIKRPFLLLEIKKNWKLKPSKKDGMILILSAVGLSLSFFLSAINPMTAFIHWSFFDVMNASYLLGFLMAFFILKKIALRPK